MSRRADTTADRTIVESPATPIHAVVALEEAVSAAEAATVAALLDRRWPELLATAPPELLAAALRLAPPPVGSGAALLALALDWLGGARKGTVDALAACAAAGEPPALAARMMLAALADNSHASASTLARWLDEASRAAAAEVTYSVTLFGDPKVVAETAAQTIEVRFTLRRALELFAFLALAPGHSARRDDLVLAAWPDDDEMTVERNFHPTLSHLRRDLSVAGPRRHRGSRIASPLLLASGVYRLDPAFVWDVDVTRFVSLAQRGRGLRAAGDDAAAAAAWEAAWRLYKGPLLDGSFAPWVANRREALALVRQEILQDLGTLYAEQGRDGEALDTFRSVLVADPLVEHAHLALMRLYARGGRRDLVRHQYDQLSRLLRRELGVAPMDETNDEYHRLMV